MVKQCYVCKRLGSKNLKLSFHRFKEPDSTSSGTLTDKPGAEDTSDLNQSFKKSQCQKSFNVKRPSFNQRSIRTEQIRKGPSPCQYNPADPTWCDGRTVPREYPRFKLNPYETPGVGTYMIHPKYDTATFGAWNTHNLKLKEKVLRGRLCLAPKETYKAWFEKMQTPKKLKWFKNKDGVLCL